MWSKSKKRYTNLDDRYRQATFKDMRNWRKERKSKQKDLSYQVSREDHPDLAFLQNNRDKLSITWIGHASFLIQINGFNILLDPVWAKRMGFEKRLSDPGLPLSDLPQIDIVLISHGHYDHLDFPTLRRLQGDPVFFVPVGLGRLFNRKGYQKVIELDWWEEREIDEVKLTFVPAQHWTRRTPWDMNTSHWGGWVIEYGDETLYFAGDSGYFNGFKEIGERFSIDYALMPIGAYEPEWFMGMQHVTPEQAIQAYLDLKAKHFIPMHYGAFRLADDTPKEALDRLLREWDRLQLPKEELLLPKLGEIFLG